MTIADNLARVRERIAAAAESAGRSADEITLVGVTKYVSPREASELAAAGCTDLGESRPQELWSKYEALQRAGASPPPTFKHAGEFAQPQSIRTSPAIRWHLIGHLQRNKVRRTLPLVSLIHSIDNERLLAAINDAQGESGNNPLPVNALLEVNTSGESTKYGLAPDAVEPLLGAASRYPHVAIRGLMTMAALEGGETIAAHNFATLRELRDRLRSSAPSCASLDTLSMGMSGDFEVAIREGATMVRIGSLLW
ncbi:MAG: YggS family pyridoxal phosphate-dependent enzyme [Planctomycetes bacterium]|nr:YggS family pyridoxal phosphate-dependent enzyme [Planctomycetota bacterium]